jgi:serine/threonine-protein kinase RsbW
MGMKLYFPMQQDAEPGGALVSASASPPEEGTRRHAQFMIQASLAEVSRVAQALRLFIPDQMSDEDKMAVELGCVEALTNIVTHGYHNEESKTVEVNYDHTSTGIVIELRDHGQAIPEQNLAQAGSQVFEFDPDDIASLPESGMGLALIKASFDVVRYERSADVNILRLEKHFQTG